MTVKIKMLLDYLDDITALENIHKNNILALIDDIIKEIMGGKNVE